MASLLARIAKAYPFCLPEICKNLVKAFPHHASNFDAIAVYQKFAYSLIEKLLKQCVKEMYTSQNSQTSLSGIFKQEAKRSAPLRQTLEFEQQLLGKVVDKIAMLDSEVKIRGRKGATFPSANKNHRIQN